MDKQYVQGRSLFTHINKISKQYPYLTENIETEVVIIGGGVTGSIVGYYLTKNNISTILLEKKRIAHGSTSITTSLLQYELDSNARELEQYTSLENVITSYQLGLKALEEIKNFIKENGNRCDYREKDTLLYTAKQDEVAEMEEEYKVRRESGLDVELITKENNPFSFDLKAGVYGVKGGAELDPYKYTHQLLEVASKKGLKIYENTEVKEIIYDEQGVTLITDYGYIVKAKKVILATGYDTNCFTKRNFGTKTTTYNIATKPCGTIDEWTDKVLIRDNEDPYHYFRTTSDGRILAGGEDISFVPGIFNEQAAKEKYNILYQRISQMFPHIKPMEIEYKYCGAFASTQDNLGFIGEDPNHKHLWYALGYGANGILFAILGGMMLSKLYFGEKDENLKLFRADRFDC